MRGRRGLRAGGRSGGVATGGGGAWAATAEMIGRRLRVGVASRGLSGRRRVRRPGRGESGRGQARGVAICGGVVQGEGGAPAATAEMIGRDSRPRPEWAEPAGTGLGIGSDWGKELHRRGVWAWLNQRRRWRRGLGGDDGYDWSGRASKGKSGRSRPGVLGGAALGRTRAGRG